MCDLPAPHGALIKLKDPRLKADGSLRSSDRKGKRFLLSLGTVYGQPIPLEDTRLTLAGPKTAVPYRSCRKWPSPHWKHSYIVARSDRAVWQSPAAGIILPVTTKEVGAVQPDLCEKPPQTSISKKYFQHNGAGGGELFTVRA